MQVSAQLSHLSNSAKPSCGTNAGHNHMAEQAAENLKVRGHEGRLMILFHLLSAELSVIKLEHKLGLSQAAVSQHLTRLRLQGIVSCRKDGRERFYSLADQRIALLVEVVCDLYGIADL